MDDQTNCYQPKARTPELNVTMLVAALDQLSAYADSVAAYWVGSSSGSAQ